MTYNEVLENARKNMAPKCKVCPDCNGFGCRGEIPGVGSVGNGKSFTTARTYLQSINLNMDAVHEDYDIDTSIELFGKKFAVPFFAAPIGGMSFNYTNYITDEEYVDITLKAAIECGSFAFTGDTPNPEYVKMIAPKVKEAGGLTATIVKPFSNQSMIDKILMLEESGLMAAGTDIDAVALANVKLQGLRTSPKSVEDLKEIISKIHVPFIVKGIMTAKSALKCKEAGCYGIVVSNHGGRIMEDLPAPASMLAEIRAAVGPEFKIFVDGGIRSGHDVFKCLALGADAVLIGRPYAIAVHGGLEEGFKIYNEKIATELSEAMRMTDCRTLKDITRDKIAMFSF